MNEQKDESDERTGVKFVYLRDPEEPNRVVTFAYEREDGTIRYSYAVNKVISPKKWSGKKKPKVFDAHCKRVARLLTSERLKSIKRAHLAIDSGEPVMARISDDFRSKYLDLLALRSTVSHIRKVVFGVLWNIERHKQFATANVTTDGKNRLVD